MNKKIIGLGLIAIAFLLSYFINLNGLSTVNVAIILFFGVIAWVGIYVLVSELMPNPAGAQFKLWKTFIKGIIGFAVFFVVMMLGIKNTHDYVNTQLSKYGVITNAVVVDKDYTTLPAKRGRTSQVHFLTIQFQDENGNKKQVKSEVVEYQYVNTNVGTQLKIKYSSKEPAIHEIIF